jgi:preprotein translocase subunit SecA
MLLNLTNRYRDVIISTEQSESDWYFSGAAVPKDSKGSWEKEHSNNKDEQIRLLESVCVQHEIDHLNGVICMDRKRDTTIVKDRKVGRNEPCPCGSGKKYKKCCIGK